MKYKITITKYEKNDDYEAEMAKWKEDTKYSAKYEPMPEPPRLEKAERSLEVFLTEEEYNEVKKGVLSTFK